MFFGSALNNFGVRELLDCFINYAPPPLPRLTDCREVTPDDPKFSGFIFKIHANMDPKHRDRLAFLRVCSGKFERHKKLYHVRSGKPIKFSTPTAFMAQEKEIVDAAYPGDIIGLHDTGNLKIGDTITDSEVMSYKGIPSFSPEIFKSVINEDPLKTKQLNKGLAQLCEEGVAQLFIKVSDQRKVVGTVGALQFEVIQYRLANEYHAQCRFEPLNFVKACWIDGPDDLIQAFIQARQRQIAKDSDDNYMYLAETLWSLDRERKENPEITFHYTSEY